MKRATNARRPKALSEKAIRYYSRPEAMEEMLLLEKVRKLLGGLDCLRSVAAQIANEAEELLRVQALIQRCAIEDQRVPRDRG